MEKEPRIRPRPLHLGHIPHDQILEIEFDIANSGVEGNINSHLLGSAAQITIDIISVGEGYATENFFIEMDRKGELRLTALGIFDSLADKA